VQFKASRFLLASLCAQVLCSLTAQAQNVTVVPTSLSFASQAEGTTSASKNVTLKNGQKTAITIAGISTGASDFQGTNNCPVSPAILAAGASCTVAISFSPTATGTRSGTLTITDSGASSPQTVALSGTGAAPLLVSIAVTPALPSIVAGATQQFAATGTYSNGSTQVLTSTAKWGSSSAAVATITSGGLATGKSQGTATIKAVSGTITGSASLAVAPPVLTSLAITPATSSIVAGKSEQFTATGTYSDGSKQNLTSSVQWSSSATAVATINSAGLVSTTAQGSAAISASIGTKSGSATLTVTAPTLTSISVAPAGPSVEVGKTQQFTATGTYSNGTTQNLTSTAKWSSSTTSVATITATGLATGKGVGTANIQAVSGGITGPTSLTVTAAVLVSISVTPAAPTIAEGKTEQFTATGTYDNGSTQNLTSKVQWSSSATSVAAVSSSGLATSSAQGSATITATSGSITGSAALKVNPPVLVSISVTPSPAAVAAGTTEQFTATGIYSDGSTRNLTVTAQWTSSAAAVATIASGGLANGLTQGSATITAASGTIKGFSALTVGPPVLTSIAINPSSSSIAKGTNQQFTATGNYSDGSTQPLTSGVNWGASPATIATISNGGLASGTGSGTATISATYNSFSASATLSVGQPLLLSLSVTAPNLYFALGTSQQFAATGTYSDGSTLDLTNSASWSTADGTIATVNAQGLATSVAVGNTAITAAVGAISGSAGLAVTPAVLVSIAVTPAIPSIPLGMTQPFTATGTFTDGSMQNITGTVQWSSDTPAVATIGNDPSSAGMANSASPGTANITASAGSVTGSSTLTVTSAVMTALAVTPASPALPLGTTQQFNATATFSNGTTQDVTEAALWSSDTPSTITILPTGMASTLATGTATITASAGTLSASAMVTVTAAVPVSIAMNPLSSAIPLGATQSFTAIATFTDGTTEDVTQSGHWSSTASPVATISNTTNTAGLASTLTTGVTTIAISLGGISASAQLTVNPAALASTAISPLTPSIALGMSQQFTATGTYTDGTTQDVTSIVTWATSDATVAIISNSVGSYGLSTSSGQGSATITASSGPVSSSTSLTVNAPALVSISIAPANVSLPVGTSQQLTATGTYTDGSTQDLTLVAVWTSDSGAALVSAGGLVSGAAIGTANISATAGSISSSAPLSVTAPVVTSISINPVVTSIAKGTTQQFSAIATYSDGSILDVTQSAIWTSSSPAIGAVNSAGLASGAAVGIATISATLGSTTNSAALSVTVPVVASIAINPSATSIAKGATQQFSAIATYSDGSIRDVTQSAAWVSSSPTMGPVNSTGLASGTGVGIATISATLGSVTNSAALSVTAAAVTSITINPSVTSIAKGATQQFSAMATYSDGSTQDLTQSVTWSSSGLNIAAVSAAGVASGAGVGTTSISATLGSVTNSAALSVTAAVVTSITINPTATSIVKGATQQFSAMATYSDGSTQDLSQSATWSSSGLNIAVVSSAGLASGAGVGTTLISATVGSVTGSASLTVGSATPVSLIVAPTNLTLSAGAQIQFSATASYTDGSSQDVSNTVTWTSSNPAAATVSSAGLVATLEAGSSSIQATLGANLSSSSSLTIDAPNTFFVAPNGNDSWSGQSSSPNGNGSDGPFASLSRAQYAVRSAPKPATVLLRNGTYYLALTSSTGNSYPGALSFTSADSGTSATAAVTWQNYPGESPVISGGVPANADPVSGAGLHLQWTNSGNVYQAALPSALSSGATLQPFESLYYNGQRRLRSRIHDNGTSPLPSMGYFMQNGQCVASTNTPPGQPSPTLASCNLGTFLRVANTIAPSSALGQGCPYEAGLLNGVTVSKCLDRFFYTSTSGGDPITAWQNVSNVYTGNAASPCAQNSGNTYPSGDVELTMFQSWTADIMRVNCVDTADRVIFLTGPTKGGGTVASTDLNYNHFGPAIGHRYIVENSLDAFNNALTPASSQFGLTGIWFLDRHATPWVLNYIANENENPTADNIVIPQLGSPIPGNPATDYIGGSLISAIGLNYVTFQGIGFEVDNFYPSSTGFNNDINGEMPVPQAIDCENCQFVTFNALTVRHTSASGILVAATAATPVCSAGIPLSCVAIENSTFYDIGDSAVRIGHTIKSTDTSTTVVQQVLVQNNVIQGFSRVFPDGEGIAEGNGNSNQLSYNTISDGYHAGISICQNGCGPTKNGASVSGNHIVSSHNLISSVMQGITSDGGALYYNVGSATSSATGDLIDSNIVNNVTDDYIIDNATTAGTTVTGSAYGGEGIYLDAQSANVTVTNNVVYNLSGHAMSLTEGLASSTEKQNTFSNNIFAFANLAMFYQQTPWPTGCPSAPIKQVDVLDNIFYFDRTSASTPSFNVIQGCRDSCKQAYNTFQNFQGNIYWRTDGQFAADSGAFQVLTTQGLNASNACKTGPNTSLIFSSLIGASWQSGGKGVPVAMNEDLSPNSTASYQPAFSGSGLITDVPSDYLLDPTQVLPTAFAPAATNATINTAHSSVPLPATVPPTFPTYVYGSTSSKF
jgi:trimeric autotransporter adhesin